MRIALISDIHANLVALNAALADIQRVGVDQIICLGDVVDLGPRPRATLARIRALGCPVVMGNHDPFYERLTGPLSLLPLHDWVRAQLSAADLDFLRAGVPTLRADLGHGKTLLCVHGSPRSYNDPILRDTDPSDLDTWLGDVDFDALVCGHTHVQLLRRHRGRPVVNVGSVGTPFDVPFSGTPPRILPWAEYAIVSADAHSLSVDLRRVDFDLEAFRRSVLESAMPGGVEWLTQWERTP
jgi:predicted phosphodiesterase